MQDKTLLPTRQLGLDVTLDDDAHFENFFLEPENTEAVAALQASLQPDVRINQLLWGASGSGLTHLLQAWVTAAQQQTLCSAYIDLQSVQNDRSLRLLNNIDGYHYLALDNLQVLAGNSAMQEAAFHCYNRLVDHGGNILFASHCSPLSLDIALADLKSRVLASTVYQVRAMPDGSKAEALRMRAKNRGMTLNSDVTDYILSRAPRNVKDLFLLLKELDLVSLQQQRKITIPFVKQVMSERGFM